MATKKGVEEKTKPVFGLLAAKDRTIPRYIVGVDPGTDTSAVVVIETVSRTISLHGIHHNPEILLLLRDFPARDHSHLSVEMVSNYGMRVGWETFETIYWIGRFCEAWGNEATLARLYRMQARMHLCGSCRAGDAEVWQVLVDRFGPGKERAVGTKKSPGPLYGIKSHERSALAIGMVYWDLLNGIDYPVPPRLDQPLSVL
jgi:hypothetical protein